ncbi:hypothetical protein D3C76_1630000 [compost metagenome]
MATSIVRNNAESLVYEEQHLGIPIIARQRPAMMEKDDFSIFWSPVLVENVNAIASGYVTHINSPIQQLVKG